jgi:hypothetical protein
LPIKPNEGRERGSSVNLVRKHRKRHRVHQTNKVVQPCITTRMAKESSNVASDTESFIVDAVFDDWEESAGNGAVAI